MIENVNIAGPLAAALEAKGYASLTPVQEAVLVEEAAGRDLLVSAQTGSGKTVAFGLAIAPDLLAGAERFLFADVPQALIIAPTRELALQVARELEWLYAEAGAKIATCVGGMDYRTEKRRLDQGAHIVVGTPGRLRDHIDRRSLDLSGLKAAVLDEADEMLDLGFRDDLEYILAQAPEDRRTLMFSATVPKAIAELAKVFQNDALRLQTAGEAKQHVDIEYRALSVQVRDRENAIFNLLRFYEAPTAIVFCKTRVNVNSLMARMGNRGFKVVALSGELSQQERTNALTSLRSGRAQVCIATDVAARGIDLPGLELVIHADLPSNSEILLHRSGRTGRAGSKGVSALIVAPSEFRKAQRLLQGAKVVAEWGAAPSADEVQERDDQRILEHPALGPNDGENAVLAATLLDRFGAEQVAAAFVSIWRQGRSSPEVLSEVANAGERAAPAPRGEFGASVWYTISVGHTGRAEARWLLPKICEAGGITKDGIGAIRVQHDLTYVQIGKAVADKFGAGLAIEEGVEMVRMEGEPSLDRPERPARPARAEKPAYKAKPSRFIEDDAPLPERKPYTKREPAGDAWSSDSGTPAGFEGKAEGSKRAAKPYAKPEGAKPYAKPAGDKPYGKPAARPADGEKKAWVKREPGDGKPWEDRGDAPARKPYAKREDGAKPYAKPAGDKPYAPRGDKPYAKRAEGEGAKPYARKAEGDAPKPYAKRADGAKPYAPRGASPDAGGERKPRWKPEEGAAAKPRSAGMKSHGGAEGKPARSAGFKSHGAEGKSFGKPSAGKPFAKPAKPKANPNDTSKRFVPPKKG
jgi:ATP-dependent RNA helicase DeaD